MVSLALRQPTALSSNNLPKPPKAPVDSSPRIPRSPWHSGFGYLLPCSFNSRLYTLVYLRLFAATEAFGSSNSAPPGCCPFSFLLHTVASLNWLKPISSARKRWVNTKPGRIAS